MSKYRKKLLVISTLLMMTVGVAIASIPFVLSLFPSERADAALPRIDISDITLGSYKLVTPSEAFETFDGFKQSVYFIKTRDGKLKAWTVYAKNGEVGMPDYHWWRTYSTCREFRPDLIDGFVDEKSLIQCHDRYLSPGQASYWKWQLDGKAVAQQYVDDMQPARGLVEGNYFVLGKKR